MANDQSITNTDDSDDDGSINPFKIVARPKSSTTYDIWLSSSVEQETLDYVDICQTLLNAGKEDSVTLHLANRGGSVDTGIMLINAMQNCKPGVDVIVESRCFSMGALLAIAGKSLVMRPGAWLMFHNYSSGEFGKGKEMLDAVQHTHAHLHHWISEFAAPFLTKRELAKLAKDEDVYVRYNDRGLRSRIKRHFG